jgi:hypothetical protein
MKKIRPCRLRIYRERTSIQVSICVPKTGFLMPRRWFSKAAPSPGSLVGECVDSYFYHSHRFVPDLAYTSSEKLSCALQTARRKSFADFQTNLRLCRLESGAQTALFLSGFFRFSHVLRFEFLRHQSGHLALRSIRQVAQSSAIVALCFTTFWRKCRASIVTENYGIRYSLTNSVD